MKTAAGAGRKAKKRHCQELNNSTPLFRSLIIIRP